jgi:hypothetical protein
VSYSATNGIPRFLIKKLFLPTLKNSLSRYSAGVVVVNSDVVAMAPVLRQIISEDGFMRDTDSHPSV